MGFRALARRGAEVLWRLPPRAVLGIAWGLVFLYGYPGLLEGEAIKMLVIIRNDATGTMPPTPVATLWRLGEVLLGGPVAVMCLQTSSLLTGLYLIIKRRASRSAAAWISAAVFLLPPVALPSVVISDVAVAAGMSALGIGAALSARTWARVGGLVALSCAALFFPPALAVSLPVLLFSLGEGRWQRRLALGLATWALLAAAAVGARAVIVARAASSAAAAPEVEPPPSTMIHRLFVKPRPKVQARQDKVDYLTDLGILNRWSPVQESWTAAVRAIAKSTPLFSPWVYLALIIAVGARARRDRLLAPLCAGALLYSAALPFFPRGPVYLAWHWTIVAATLATAVWIASRRAAAREEAAERAQQQSAASDEGAGISALARLARGISPRVILAVGWVQLLLYCYPGYMSFDSIRQLLEARSGVYSDAHPPVMAIIWSLIDHVIAGPFGMFLLQSLVLLWGAYFIGRRFVSPRVAAICAALLMAWPPVASVMGVIWKDSLMVAFLMAGTALLLSPRRAVQVGGLGALWLATAIRHNAPAMTLPLIVLLFVWRPDIAGWRRYAIAGFAWLAVTFSAREATRALAATHIDLWHDSMALYEIVGTLQHLPEMTDDEVRALLAGARTKPASGLKEAARPSRASENYLGAVVTAGHTFFERPTSAADREAIARAWKNVVIGHPVAFLRYRLEASTQILQLRGPQGFPIYFWFVDIQNPAKSAASIGHNSTISTIQSWLRHWMVFVCSSWASRLFIYFFMAVALWLVCVRRRFFIAILSSALMGEVAILVIFPAPDTRYSLWMVVVSFFTALLLIGEQIERRVLAPKATT